MSNDTKFIVTEVNKLLNKNYNIISYNALNQDDLLQLLSDVLANIENNNVKIDIRTENPELRAVRIFSILRILKYQPNIDAVVFRQNLVKGDTETINEILKWLLSRLDVMKQRAYLARFLVKVEVQPEFLLDSDISVLYEQYSSLVEQFMIVHKEREAGKKSGETAAELKADLFAMEKEKEIVLMRMEKIKTRAEPAAYLIELARALRNGREEERDYALQKEQERESISALQISLQRMERELQSLKQDGEWITAAAILQRSIEEVTVLATIVKEKLPAEIKAKRTRIRALNTVESFGYYNTDSITMLKNTLDSTLREVHSLIQEKVANADSDKMEPFRHQAIAISNKKRHVLEKLENVDINLAKLREKLQEKIEQSKMLIEGAIPKGEELKKYILYLKTKSFTYKRGKVELAGLKAENGVLQRTSLILGNQEANLQKSDRFSGFQKITIPKNYTPDNALTKNIELSNKISDLRTRVTPINNKLQDLRQKVQEVRKAHEKFTKNRDSVAADIIASTDNLLKEIEISKEKIKKATDEKEELVKKMSRIKEIEEKIKNETNNFSSNQSLINEINNAITSEEKILSELKNEKSSIEKTSTQNAMQSQMWKTIISVFQSKMQCAEESKQKDGIVVKGGGSETLILNV